MIEGGYISVSCDECGHEEELPLDDFMLATGYDYSFGLDNGDVNGDIEWVEHEGRHLCLSCREGEE